MASQAQTSKELVYHLSAMFSPADQTKNNLPHISCVSLQVMSPGHGVWKDALQRPVEMSRILSVPAESLEITIPSSACRLTDLVEVEESDVDFGSVDEVLICQNLTDRSLDAEMREEGEEILREGITAACPTKVSTRRGSELVMSQT